MTGNPEIREKRKGPRPKHIPIRTCVVCRDKEAKRQFVRIVRTPDGTIEVDPTGKKNGRGAYLCTRFACWERALSSPLLDRALRVDLTAGAKAALRQYAEEHFPQGEDA